MNFTILRFDSIDSTNSEALRQARKGADEGLCIIARQQTGGRGRQGRTWASPMDAGLYCTIVLKPKLEDRFLPLITLTAAVAVHAGLTELGLQPDIKWPNDVLVNEKKICGILAETTETPTAQAVVVGIGINLNSKSFAAELAAKATSIADQLGRADSSAVEELLLNYFGHYYRQLIDKGPAEILVEWKRRSTYFSGKAVRVTLQNTTFEGVTDGLEDNGSLRVTKVSGEVALVTAGDVEHLRAAIV
jgi:BirA family biotin operon repressor/biotin-[acetyl-CoA-carboxylase] ligase